MLEEIMRKHALKNACDYGKADANAIIGKVIAELPETKKDMKSAMERLKAIVSEVNKLKKAEIEGQLKEYSFVEKKGDAERKLRIDGAEEGKVITRFLPEPNGYLHLGHAKAAFLSFELARQYSGKCILRFDDTNPEAETREYVDSIKENLIWLGLEFASENYTSDKMPQLYKFAEKMIILGKAYVCMCSKDEVNKNRFGKKACDCRERHGGENFRMWEEMIAGKIKKGERILRLKADMQSENTVMRDPTLFRIIDSPHYRQGKKYVCWPTYDFEVSISDSIDGITHALRSKEYELRDELYYAILSAVNMRKPMVYDFSRLNMKGTVLSKRLIRPLIEKKQVEGWDDPRLATLMGLRRRGILPDAIREFVMRQGLSKAETEPEFKDLLAINRKLLNPVAPHQVFVPDPVKLAIRNKDEENEYFIPGDDVKAFKIHGQVALIRNMAVEIIEKKKTIVTANEINAEKMPEIKVQWLSASEGSSLKCEIMEIGDLLDEKGGINKEGIQIRKGLCGKECASLNAGDIVQFDRYGFCKLDKKEKEKLIFIFSC